MPAECCPGPVESELDAVYAGGPPGCWFEGERSQEVQLRSQVPPPTDMRGTCAARLFHLLHMPAFAPEVLLRSTTIVQTWVAWAIKR